MKNGKQIAVVVPCYNEANQIEKVIKTMPRIVDLVVVVDDKSTDETVKKVESLSSSCEGFTLELICHESNQGVGGAIATGYKRALEAKVDVAVVMAGDGQMDPADFDDIVKPVLEGGCDYSKGNRLFTGDAWRKIPRLRYLGNSVLSLLTKIASGYWHVADSQSGYTAISYRALETINWNDMYKRYGQPNDLLVRLNIYNFRVRDVPIAPVYDVGEISGMNPIGVIPKLSWLIFKLFFYRMKQKYFIRDFHPLLFFYAVGLTLFPAGTIFGLHLVIARLLGNAVAETSALLAVFLATMGTQFLLFAMWMDMEYNKDLK